jgi:putative membrane protein
MHNWNNGYDAWWWMVAMMVVMLVVVGAVVWALMNAARPDQPASPTPPNAEEVLAQRLAAGEIDTAEYNERRDALRGRVPQSG